MKEIRLGIAGIGNMGGSHAQKITEGKVAGCRLAAVSDVNPATAERFPLSRYYPTAEEMIRSGEIDAILISTPHYFHTPIGIAALEAGLHVLVEKPISVHKADCERLIAAHTDKNLVFAAMFNLRTDPLYRKLKTFLDAGEAGEIRRINWIATQWFRTQGYYNNGGWRATWAGEGGGVLLNQCPHQLDLWQYLFGMPESVHAFCSFGRYHEIEVEDDVTAVFRYANGSSGVFIASTGEAPGTNRLEITGERGRVVVEGRKIHFTRNEETMTSYSRDPKNSYGTPATWEIDIPVPPTQNGSGHLETIQNFVDAILKGTPVLAPAAEGIHSVELANVMILSSFEGRTISLPMNSERYEAVLAGLIAGHAPEGSAPAEAEACLV